MKKLNDFQYKALTALTLAIAASGVAGAADVAPALTSAGFDISDAKTGLASILGVGVAIVIGMTVFRVGRRGANMV